MHKRLMEPVLAAMDPEKAVYFGGVADELAVDKRIERNANMVFLFLAAAAPYLPTQLPKRDMIGRLITFVERNQHRLVKTVFSAAYLTDKDLIKPVVAEFVQETTAQVMLKMEEGDLDADTGLSVYRVGWPFKAEDFPYVDDEEED